MPAFSCMASAMPSTGTHRAGPCQPRSRGPRGNRMRPRHHWTIRWAWRLSLLAVLTIGTMLAADVAQALGFAPQIAAVLRGHHAEAARGVNAGQTAVLATHTAFTQPLAIPPVLTGPDITLTAAETDVPILAGQVSKMWTF